MTDPIPDPIADLITDPATDLDALTADERTALAAAVAERLLPYFERFHERTGAGSPGVLDSALADVRRRLAGGPEVTLQTMLDAFGQVQIAADHLTEPVGGTLDEAARRAHLAWYAAAAVTNACHASVHGRVHEVRLCLRYEEMAARLVGDVRG